MTRLILIALVLIALFTGLLVAGQNGYGPLIVTREGEQRVILFLREAKAVTAPGLRVWWPEPLGASRSYPSRWLHLNTEPDTVQTTDGEQLIVDNYAIWRISDAIQFQRSFPSGKVEAEKRIDRAVRDDVREVIGRYTLSDVIKEKRKSLMKEITDKTRSEVASFGIEVSDVRINRTDLPGETLDSVYSRMTTERERLAKKNRSEGEEQARRIRAEADRDARVILANAKRDSEIARGEGDAEATRIYAESYGSDPDFYSFTRSLEAYRKSIDGKTTLVLSPDSEFFRYLQSSQPEPPVSAPPGP
ncbi:MAG: protease modulator HflC [Myxococcota bacterium]